MPEAFNDVTITSLYNPETNKNTADIFCPKEGCRCLIIRKNTAVLVERDADKLSLPESVLPAEANVSDDKEDTQFWLLKDMMDFDNVGFSKTVGSVKFLSCADCDLGPLGYHDTACSPKEFLISIRRARYRF
ncbi:Mss4-like protein [Hesseltinella vesiculosa]|uniref:Mss4-like protein n=1 Tax=Hesseltinella vesiculosa TaxID=101127 RepID=A0A1X2G6Q6_9FUNG|nr:Mss4-like protein [Hesseltinella vesiculosa]